jgi:hypothetical protein
MKLQSGDIIFEVELSGLARSGKYSWGFRVCNTEGDVIVDWTGDLETPTDDPIKAVEAIIGFTTCDDKELFEENEWTHDPYEIDSLLEYDYENSAVENKYVVTEVDD